MCNSRCRAALTGHANSVAGPPFLQDLARRVVAPPGGTLTATRFRNFSVQRFQFDPQSRYAGYHAWLGLALTNWRRLIIEHPVRCDYPRSYLTPTEAPGGTSDV
jgi:hypothetical protein